MTEALVPGDRVDLHYWARPGEVRALLGEGGQGGVYEIAVASGTGEHRLALKWYSASSATEDQWHALVTLINRGAPDPRFLWPLDLATRPDDAGRFGYVMPIRRPEVAAMLSCIDGRVPTTVAARVMAGLHLARAMLALHSEGLCYRDVNFGNVFLDPADGEIAICDTDNVGINLVAPTTVMGTPGFIAPEILRRQAVPSIDSDRHSLAVLLFWLIVRADPLRGRHELEHRFFDSVAQLRLWGTDPLFVFHPSDEGNRPVPGLHDNALAIWPALPASFRDRCTQAFVAGLDDPARGRVTESAWMEEFARLRDALWRCPRCGDEVFDDPRADDETLRRRRCWSCQAPLGRPPRWCSERHAVALCPGTRLYAHHLSRPGDHRLYDFTTPVAEVGARPDDPRVWGIKNLTERPWSVWNGAGAATTVAPNQRVIVTDGLWIDIDGVRATLDVDAGSGDRAGAARA